ncbi:uncharacterized protein LOC124420167 [Lucilia cuprina]|uniref:uncharacterized protein LOC124420167 n=1 Tax=Lucilia cuprina TaxID=7375 RepID=UPI001F056A68|nr:uncharacterized protein LOC124420167 [Lucilia cuprina]
MNTAKHQKTIKPFHETELIHNQISFTKIATEKQNSQAMLALFIAVHNSLLSVNHLGALCNSAFKDSKAANFSLHRTKSTNIITNVLALHFVDNLLEVIGDSSFSLILDEGTDIPVEKLLDVVIRYYSRDKEQFITTFLGLIDLEGGKADDLLKGLERLTILFKLDLTKLLAIGTDNAAIMVLTEKLKKNIIKKISS